GLSALWGDSPSPEGGNPSHIVRPVWVSPPERITEAGERQGRRSPGGRWPVSAIPLRDRRRQLCHKMGAAPTGRAPTGTPRAGAAPGGEGRELAMVEPRAGRSDECRVPSDEWDEAPLTHHSSVIAHHSS